MTSYVTPKKNAAFVFLVSLPSQANGAIFQSSPTLAAGDVKVSIDGGALNNLTSLPTVAPAASKGVQVSLTAAEMNGDNIRVAFSDVAGAEWCDVMIHIQTTASQIDDLALQSTLNTVATYVDTEVAAIKAKTDNLPSDPADASDIAALIAALPTALLDAADGVESGLTLRQFARLTAAVLFGKASGMTSTTAVFRDIGDTKDRITATVDADGNRTNVTRDSA